MAYQLTLTASEREAFDWVGDRYATGDEWSRLLSHCMGEDDEWSQAGDITFDVPEHVAWQLNDLAESEDYLFPCFAPGLAGKLMDFCMAIV
jgi:hypothetical protein